MIEHDGSTTADGIPAEPAGTDAARGELAASGEGLDLEAVLLADPRDRAELMSALLDAERQRDGFLDDLQRSRADFDNYRKRVARDAAAQREHGRIDVVHALIDTLDDLDRTEAAIAALGADAGAASSADDAGLAHGIGLVAARLRGALGGFGLERIDAAGVAFDPTVHEAVQHVAHEAAQRVPADAASGDAVADDGPRVVEVLRPGYRLGERVLRAAMVVVAG